MAAAQALEAASAFGDGDYEAAQSKLGALRGDKAFTSDHKLAINSALVRFATGGCADTSALLTELAAVNRHLKAATGADGAAPEDTSMHLLLYNQAVALAQQEQHASAASVLESLFRRIEPCDEWVAMRAAFLLLDVYARTFLGTQAEDNNLGLVTQKARAVLQYLEQAHVFTDATATAACIAAAMPASTQGAEAGPLSSYAVAAGRMVVAHFTATLAVHRARLALCTDDVAGCMQHLKVVFDTCAGAGGAAASGDTGSAFSTTLPPADGTDVGGVGAAPRDPTQPGWVQLHCTRQLALSLRAEVAARRRHFTRAVKLLGTCLAESESVARKLGPLNVAGDRGLQVCQYLNNLGALQGRQGNVAAAVLLFTKAVDACLAHNAAHGLTPVASAALRSTEGGEAGAGAAHAAAPGVAPPNPPSSAKAPPPHTNLAVGGGVTPPRLAPVADVLANLGVALLLARQPARALLALQGATSARRHQPRLWLRMAEACLLAHSLRLTSGPGHTHAMPVVPTDGGGAEVTCSGESAPPPGTPAASAFHSAGAGGGRAENVGDGGAELCWAGVGLVSSKAGAGPQQRLHLASGRPDSAPPAPGLPGVGDPAPSSGLSLDTSTRPALTLDFAVTCLLNCVALLPHPMQLASSMSSSVSRALKALGEGAGAAGAAAAEEGGEGGGSTPPSPAARATAQALTMTTLRWGQCRLRQAALCKLAYAALSRGDPHLAVAACQHVWSAAHVMQPVLTAARSALQQATQQPAAEGGGVSPLVDPWRFLAYSYMCEALCLMGHAAEGRQYLGRVAAPTEGGQQGGGIQLPTGPPGTSDPAPLFDPADRVPTSLPQEVPRNTAVSSMFTNVAIAHLLTGDGDAAASAAGQALMHSPTSLFARGLSAYLSLRRGAHGEAAALVNRGLVHSRPPQAQQPVPPAPAPAA